MVRCFDDIHQLLRNGAKNQITKLAFYRGPANKGTSNSSGRLGHEWNVAEEDKSLGPMGELECTGVAP
jgi:hypothetical protein